MVNEPEKALASKRQSPRCVSEGGQARGTAVLCKRECPGIAAFEGRVIRGETALKHAEAEYARLG